MSDSNSKQVCPECKSEEDWRGASWCPSCGYYPAINRQVESASAVQQADEEVYEHWWQVIPLWMWLLAAGCLALLVMSVAVRLIFAESIVRTWWTYGQMGLGLIVMCVVHFMAYLYGVSKSDKLGPLDMFMRPVATWQPVLMNLPDSSKLVCTMGCSVVAIALGFFVIDGIDYVAIMQADAAARNKEKAAQAAKDKAAGKKKTSAMGMMMQTAGGIAQAKNALSPNNGGAPETLEEALVGFAGEAGVSGEGGLAAITEGAAGGGDANGLGGAIAGLTGAAGGVDGYLKDQEAIAKGEGLIERSQEGGADPAVNGGGVDGGGGKGVSGGGFNSGGARPSTSSVSTSVGGSPLDLLGTEDSFSISDRPREEIECLILGYTTNTTGEIRSLLLAAAPDRKLLRFVAKVPVEQVDAEQLKLMMRQFNDIPARYPMVRCPFGGRWVQPEMFCIASYEGWTADNRLNNAIVHRLANVAQVE